MKVNFLNDDSNKFNQETDGLKDFSNKEEFGKKTSLEEEKQPQDSVSDEIVEDTPEEKPVKAENKKKFSEKSYNADSVDSESDFFDKPPKGKKFLKIFILLIILAGGYYGYELYLKDMFFTDTVEVADKQPISIVDSTKIKTKKPINLSQDKRAVINKSYSVIKIANNLLSLGTEAVNLRQIFIQGDVINLELQAANRNDLAKVSKNLASSLMYSSVLEETKTFNGNELLARYTIKTVGITNKKVETVLTEKIGENKLRASIGKSSIANTSIINLNTEKILSFNGNANISRVKQFLTDLNENFDNIAFNNLSILRQSDQSYLVKFNIQFVK